MNRRGSFTLGILLILVGVWFLATEFVPQINDWMASYADWPFIIIGVGLVFIMAALISGVGGLAVPGAITAGIGGILFYQNSTNDWQSWAYAWTLIIGFSGIGIFLMHLIEGKFKKAFREASDPIITSVVMFLIFSTFFRFIFGQPQFLGQAWPALLILWGFWLLIKPMFRKRRKIKVTIGNDVVVTDEDIFEEEVAAEEDDNEEVVL